MSSNRRLPKQQNAGEDSGILFYFLLAILFYPPLFRGLFFSKELLITHILTAALFMAVIYFRPGYRPMAILGNPMDYAALGLLLVYVISSFNSAVPRDALRETLKLANYVMIYYLVAYYAFREKSINRILELFYASGVLVAIIGLLPLIGLDVGVQVVKDRIYSTLQYPNTLAAFMAAIFMIGLYLYPRQDKNYKTYIICASNFLIFLSFLWTKSRGGFLFFPISVILLLSGMSEKRRTIGEFIQSVILAVAVFALSSSIASKGLTFLLIAGGVAASIGLQIVKGKMLSGLGDFNVKKWQVGVLLGLIVAGSIVSISITSAGDKVSEAFARISTTSVQERSVQERIIFYKDAIKVFKESPILGHGGGGWAGAYQKFQTYSYTSREVHNNYLQILIETGIMGFLFYAGLLISFIVTIIKTYKQSALKDLTWLVLVVAATLALNSMVDFNMTFGAISILLWSMFGLARGLKIIAQAELKEQYFILTTDRVYIKMSSLAVPAVVLIFSLSLSIGLAKGEDGLYLYNSGRNSVAEGELSSAVTFDPLNGSYSMALAEIWGAKASAQRSDQDYGAMRTALQYAKRAVELQPYNPEVHVIKGKVHLRAQQVPEAVSEYEKAISLAPTNQKYYNELAGVFLRAGKYFAYLGKEDKAREYLRKALDVPKLIEERAKDIPFSEDMPWIKEQYNLTVDNNDLKKTLEEAQNALGGL